MKEKSPDLKRKYLASGTIGHRFFRNGAEMSKTIGTVYSNNEICQNLYIIILEAHIIENL